MSCIAKPKKPLLDDTQSNNDTKSAELNKLNESEPSTSYEVFRNNTTAVEVIVKEVLNKKKKMPPEPNVSLQTIRRLKEDVESLQYQVAKSNLDLAKSRNGYRLIILEMKKQLDAATRQDMEKQKENIALLMENEKLKALLDSKTNLISKFKRELNSMKRVLKMVIKNIASVPQISEDVIISSDPEFDDFERDLKNDKVAKLVPNFFDSMCKTFDSTISKDLKDSWDKHF